MKGFVKRFGVVGKMIGVAAINGALSAVAAHVLTPDFDGKMGAVGTLAMIGAVKGLANAMSPQPQKRRGGLKPQDPPRS